LRRTRKRNEIIPLIIAKIEATPKEPSRSKNPSVNNRVMTLLKNNPGIENLTAEQWAERLAYTKQAVVILQTAYLS